MILTFGLVIPEREVFECVRLDSMSTSLGRIGFAHQHKKDDLRRLRPDGATTGADYSDTIASDTTSAT